ncbi:MAG TPA: hypothetical protein VF624_17865 [Tepidisphaeraceae bacterium]|jgi:hypothetical protein
MQLLYLLLFMAVAGCAVYDAQLGLIGQSHEGVRLVRESLVGRARVDVARNAADRKRLDEAFDDDLAARTGPIPAEWVLDARRAYAAAVDALHGRDEASLAARDADLQNLDAVDTALSELARLVRGQQRLFLIPEER